MPTLHEFLTEVEAIAPTDQKDRDAPAGTVAKDDAVSGSQRLVLHVPSPRTEIRLGQRSGPHNEEGLYAFTVRDAWLRAQQNVAVVAGSSHPDEMLQVAEDALSTVNELQKVTSLGLQFMKLSLAPGAFQVLATLGLVTMDIWSVANQLSGAADPGKLLLSGKRAVVMASGASTLLTSATSTVLWAGTTATLGANGAVTIDAGGAVALGAGIFMTAVAGVKQRVVAGFELELACRRGTTSVRGQSIEIGVPGGSFAVKKLAIRPQKQTNDVTIHARESIELTSGVRNEAGTPGPSFAYDASFRVGGGHVRAFASKEFGVRSDCISLNGPGCLLEVKEKSIHLGVWPSYESSRKADAEADKAYQSAMKSIREVRAEAMVPTVPASRAAVYAAVRARNTARRTFRAARDAAAGARDAAKAAAKTSAPSVNLASDQVRVSTSAKNGMLVSRVKGIELESGAGSIKMGPAGITLQFGPSKIILGPAGIVLDAGAGTITQKGSNVNAT